jgi:CubicO group peptidase (beta-lactamase class C family)
MPRRFLLFAIPLVLIAGELPVAKPESVGMSGERLARIRTWLNGIVERREAAGFVSLVARQGKVVHHEAAGRRGLDSSDPMPADALFDLASMTKPITVAAALMLLEEGKFALSDPIGKFIPEYANPKVETAPGVFTPARRPITVRDLFSHCSGIFDGRSRAEQMNAPSLAAYIKDLARQPLKYEPGSTYLYGTSHHVLGYLVERVSAMPLDRFVQERIFAPLGMNDTWYWPPAETGKRRAILVVNGKDDPQSLSRVPPEAAKARTFIGGASGLYSTAADYWRFSQMLLNGGAFDGKQLLGPRTIQWMAQNHIGELASFRTPGTRFGLGLAVVTDPGASGLPYSKGSYYWGGSQGTVFWIDPAEDLIGVLMVQLTPSPLKLRERFAALVYSSIVK